jgi:hypothetical protein
MTDSAGVHESLACVQKKEVPTLKRSNRSLFRNELVAALCGAVRGECGAPGVRLPFFSSQIVISKT